MPPKKKARKRKPATSKSTKKKKPSTGPRMVCAFPLLQELIETAGVSGKEDRVRHIIERAIRPHVDGITVDKVGNLVAHKKGTGPTVMLAAHMDEIGLMVKHLNDDGTMRVSTVGGIEPTTLIAQRVVIEGKKPVKGVISTKWMRDDKEVEELPGMDDLFIGTGLTKSELKRAGVRVGSYVALEQSNFCHLGKNDIISGKALDDRLGCFILVELAKKLKSRSANVYFVFTVQEEVGLYGAKASAWRLSPAWAVAVDVTNTSEEKKNKTIGRGPYIMVKDAEMITSPLLNERLERIAKKKRIRLQFDVNDSGTTDALTISLTKDGIPATTLGVVVKNLHTSVSIAHRRDVEQCVILLRELVRSPPTQVSKGTLLAK